MDENTDNEELEFPLGRELTIEDIEYPREIDKNFMQLTDDKFIINTTGGDFFPNKYLLILQISSFLYLFPFLFILPIVFDNNNTNNIFIDAIRGLGFGIFFVGGGILFMLFLNKLCDLTSIKTTFTFSNEGINISSKKGSLFIPKDNIENIKMRETKNQDRADIFIKYDIIFEFKTLIYIPYIKEYKDTVTFLGDGHFFEEIIGRNQVKFFMYYVLQEIKKTLHFSRNKENVEDMKEKKSIVSLKKNSS